MKVARSGMAVPTGPTGILASGKRGAKAGGKTPAGKPTSLSGLRGQPLTRRGR